MTADLYSKRAGDGAAVILLHGLFGSANNLGALARALQQQYAVYSLDLPNHGRSAWLPQPSLSAMADKVQQWMDDEGLVQAHFVGHSLGGKVAMELALRAPQRVSSLIVADIAPVAYAAHHESIFTALEAVAASPCSSREEAAARMAVHVSEDSVIQFLLSSLQRDKQGGYDWRFDVAGLKDALASLLVAPRADQAYEGDVLFIKGGASDYIREAHWPVIQTFFPKATLKIMPDCSHWLHAQKPQLFNGIVLRFLESAEQRKLGVPDSFEDER
ncbi:Esterase YbfF [Halioglobus japonicus]|nr:Esterase YbfF [Halioglobus japonicus]